MSKKKRIIFSLVIFIASILLFTNYSDAVSITAYADSNGNITASKMDALARYMGANNSITLGENEWNGSNRVNNLFCVRKGQRLRASGAPFKLVGRVDITSEGFDKGYALAESYSTSSGYTEKRGDNYKSVSKFNYKLAYAIATCGFSGNKSGAHTNSLQNYLWANFKDWLGSSAYPYTVWKDKTDNGKTLDPNSDKKINSTILSLPNNFALNADGVGNANRVEKEIEEEVEELTEDAEELKINGEVLLADNTTELPTDKMSYKEATFDGKTYIRIGPFKVTGLTKTGLDGLTVKGIRGDDKTNLTNDCQIIMYKYKNGNDKRGSVEDMQKLIKNNKNFYILVDQEKAYAQSSDGKGKLDEIKVSFTASVNTTKVSAHILLLKTQYTSWQNMVVVDGDVDKIDTNAEFSFTTPVPGGFILTKEGEMTGVPVKGAKFAVFRYIEDNVHGNYMQTGSKPDGSHNDYNLVSNVYHYDGQLAKIPEEVLMEAAGWTQQQAEGKTTYNYNTGEKDSNGNSIIKNLVYRGYNEEKGAYVFVNYDEYVPKASNRSYWVNNDESHTPYNLYSNEDTAPSTVPRVYVSERYLWYPSTRNNAGHWKKEGGTYVPINSKLLGSNWWKKHYTTECYKFGDNSGWVTGVNPKSVSANSDYVKATNSKGKLNFFTADGKSKRVWIYEVEAPEGYEKVVDERFSIKEFIPIGDITTELKNKNIKEPEQKGNIELIKVNADNHATIINGIKFTFKQKDGDNYVAKNRSTGKTYFTTSATDPNIWFTTGVDGKAKDDGKIYIEGVPIGDYVYQENSETLPYGYELVNNGTGTFTIKYKETNQFNVDNKQRYIKLSGYVWVDDTQENKPSQRNNKFHDSDIDIHDRLLDNIEVRVIDRRNGQIAKDINGKELKTVTKHLGLYNDQGNNGHGEYLFEGVLVDELQYYYVEFEYDGLTYNNVIPNITSNNGSKAAEATETRQNFNNNFSVITGPNEGEGADIGHTSGGQTLKYDTETNPAEPKLISNGDYEQKNDQYGDYYYQNSKGNYPITSNTDVTGYSDSTAQKKLGNFNYEGETEIRYINLGLTKREEADIGLRKFLYNVKLMVNGKEHIYNYDSRFSNAGPYDENNERAFNVGVSYTKESSITGEKSFSRAVYKADYEYINENDKSKELQLYLTYKIRIENNTTDAVQVKVNSIVDYYDSRFTYNGVGTKIDERDNFTLINDGLTPSGDMSPGDDSMQEDVGYKKLVIGNNGTIIGGQKNQDIYVQFKLNRATVAAIMQDTNEGEEAAETLDNVAEIASYSCVDASGNPYATVDKDSNPGNSKAGDKGTYAEDDTDSSLALKLKLARAREMTGKVFLDEATTDAPGGTNKERLGNGEYDENEQGIKNVTVTMKNAETGETVKVLSANNNWEDAITHTDTENGEFTITGYIPGNYKLTYTWGNETYTITNTQINVQEYKGTIYKNPDRQEHTDWYKEETPRYSDAIDDWDIRNNIDNEMNDVTAIVDTTKTMDSTTPTMDIGVEYSIESNNDEDTTITGGTFKNVIPNIDFGIIERPRQQLDISKDVTAIKIILGNGLDSIDAKVVNGKLEGVNTKGLTYMAPSREGKGFLKAEMDNELIQDAKLEIEYTFKVTNNSEVDYSTENYYKYGTDKTNIVTLEPTAVFDYFGNGMTLDTSKDNNSQGWREVTSYGDYNSNYTGDTFVEKYYKGDGQNSNIDEYLKLFNEWSTLGSGDVRNTKLNNKTIVSNSTLEQPLAPGQTNTAYLYAAKKLANTEEISLDNETEITEITRTTETGRIPDIKTSRIYDQSETVTVTTPTGNNKNYIIPIAIGISALVILGVGVIVIKRKAIEK